MHLLIFMHLIYAFNSPHLGEYIKIKLGCCANVCVCSQCECKTENSSQDYKDVIRVS